jgi:hypothetical protein
MDTNVNAQENCEKLVSKTKLKHPETVKALDDLQKKVGSLKERPIILIKRRYYAKETLKF